MALGQMLAWRAPVEAVMGLPQKILYAHVPLAWWSLASFALAAVELPEGLVVLGQVADGFGVNDIRVGDEMELVVETLYTDEEGERTTWRWKPVAGKSGEQA